MPWVGESYGSEGLDRLVLPQSYLKLGFTPSVMEDVLKAMNNMNAATAKLFLEKNYGWLEPQVIADLLEYNRDYAVSRQKALQTGISVRPFTKNKFYATAWLCGASWGQIAKLFSVNSRTVAAAAKTFLQDNNREQLRINKGPISLERLSAIKQAYTDLNNQDHLYIVDASVISIAKRVTGIVELEMNDMESAHDQAYFADESPIQQPEKSTTADDLVDRIVLAEAQEEDPTKAGALGDAQLAALKAMLSGESKPEPELPPENDDDEPSEADKQRYGL